MANEIISVVEALTRVGLPCLAQSIEAEWGKFQVEWHGFPKPMSCGHTTVRGFGPLYGHADSTGSNRAYQKKVRVSNHSAGGGSVLWQWGILDSRMSMVVTIVTPPDSTIDMCLSVSFTG